MSGILCGLQRFSINPSVLRPQSWHVASSRARDLSLWDLMPHDLRWTWCNNIKCTIKVTSLNYPETIPLLLGSVEKLSSTELFPDIRKIGDRRSRVGLNSYSYYCCCFYFQIIISHYLLIDKVHALYTWL